MNASSRTHLPIHVVLDSGRAAWLIASLACLGIGSVANAKTPEPGKIEEVIVTAQKRTEQLQDVPISISVLTGPQLDRFTEQGMTDALNRVPGVATTVSYTGGTQLAVRGVTANGPLLDGSSPIAYYIDSAPYGLVGRALAPDFSGYDLERVEALRGPQGTLYGASALNGVIRILSREVNLDEFEWKARSSLSSTDGGGENYRSDTAINVPLIEGKLAARAVAGYQGLSGWIDSPNRTDINDAVLRNWRIKVKGQPTDALTVNLAAWNSNNDYGALSIGDDDRISYDTARPGFDDTKIYSLGLNVDLQQFSISSATSYLDFTSHSSMDLDVFGLPALITNLDGTVLSEEIVLNSKRSDAWRWSVGAFYRDAETELWQNDLGGGPIPFNYLDTSKSYAIFGELGRRFLDDALEWSVGLRYFHDRLVARELISFVPGIPPAEHEYEFTHTSPRAVLTWYPAETLTIYGSYAEGFRSGGSPGILIQRDFPDFPDVKPDTLRNYEIGAKATAFDGRMTLDLAIYYMDWRDIYETLTVLFDGQLVNAGVNGESASGPGIDFALTTRPADSLELGVTVSWNDLAMDEDVRSGLTDVVFDKGDRLNLSPEYTVGVFGSYEFPLGDWTGQVSASANYTSEQIVRFGDNTEYVGDPLTIGRASFSINSSRRWTAELFVDNVNNERGAPRLGFLAVADYESRIRPRTVGLQFEYRY